MSQVRPHARDRSNQVGSLRLWYAILGGPAAWTAHLLVSYGFVYVACGTGWIFLLYLTTLVAATMALGAGVVAWRIWRPSHHGEQALRLRSVARQGFMGFLGLLMSILFFVIILVEGVPPLVLGPCA